MKIARFIHDGKIRFGVLEERIRIIEEKSILNAANKEDLDIGDIVEPEKWLPPVIPGKIICLGLNYYDHAKEARMKIPKYPILFSKAVSSLVGHKDPIIPPLGNTKVDYEVELAVIIGKKGKNIEKEDTMDYVCGYTILNDVSERAAQFEDGQWFRGKSFDTFCPLGPYLVTKDEIPNPHNLKLETYVNKELRQSSNTNNLIFKIPEIVSFCSMSMTLYPGDVIATGTPGGVGIFYDPPKLLKPGDKVTLVIEKIGKLENPVISL
jgi:2-keto-4-pentenoate hydratase/2-oxohepta-3-ene-1,7-dioic acid hydratase in catechol pathway